MRTLLFIIPPGLRRYGAGSILVLHFQVMLLLGAGPASGLERLEQVPPQVPVAMAVGLIDLEPNNVDAGEVRAISDRLRYYLGSHDVFTVIERARMEDIMKEVGFQLTGACITEECIVQVGKILGAQKMVAGSVSRVGALYTIQIRLIDIQSSRIEQQAIADVRGIEEVLQIGCEQVAEELAVRVSGRVVAAQEGPPARPTPVVVTTGRFRIVSTPPGAMVFIDGQEMGPAPQTVELPLGSHELRVELRAYHGFRDSIRVEGGESRDINVPLRAMLTGIVDITTTPAGARVLIDGEEVGRTPRLNERVVQGQRRVEIQMEGYETNVRNVLVMANQRSRVEVTLLRAGRARLTLESSHRGGRLEIDGERRGRGVPASDLELRPGEYTLAVKAAGYRVWRQTVNLEDGGEHMVSVVLRPKSRLVAGFWSTLVPGVGQFYSRKPGRGFLLLVGTAGAAGYASGFYLERDRLDGELAELQQVYNEASTVHEVISAREALLAKHTEVADNHEQLKMAAMIAGGIWALNVFDALVLMPRLPPVRSPPSATATEVRLEPARGMLGLSLQVRF